MELYIKTKLPFIVLALSVITVGFGISDVNAFWPFDTFITPTANETENRSSQDPFTNKLAGEHGESPDEDLE